MRETLSFRSRPEELHEIRQFVRERATSASWSFRDVEELAQAVSEACANSMIHSGSKQLTLTWNRETNRIEVQIQDEGSSVRHPGPRRGGAEATACPSCGRSSTRWTSAKEPLIAPEPSCGW